MSPPSAPGVRYALASVAALGTDFVLTLSLLTFTAFPLSVSAAISFVLVGCAFYFVHEVEGLSSGEIALVDERHHGNFTGHRAHLR